MLPTSNFAAPRPNIQGKGGNGNNHGQGGQGNNNRRNSNNNKDRFKKPVIKQEVSEEDVAKQVKETLARLTTKGKNKTSKYRKEKREMASNRMQELEDQEMADSKVLKLTEFVTANELATHDGCFCQPGYRYLYEYWYHGFYQPASGC